MAVASLTISGPEQLEVGQTAQLTATAHLSDGSSQDVTTATAWVTNNVNICTVNAAGVLTAVSAGQCTVNGVFQNITGTIVITCFNPGNPPAGPPSGPPSGPPNDPGPPPSGPTVGLRIEGPSSVNVGQQIQLRAFRTDNNQEVTDQATWSGNNNGVAAVGSQGRVTGVNNGAMIVHAVFQGAGAVKTITVSGGPTCPGGPGCPPEPPITCPSAACTLTGLAIQGATTVQVGQTSQLQAIASFSNGTTQNVTGQSQWSSGNAGIAGVNGTGLVTGNAAGQAPISATFGGSTASVTFTVTSGPVGPPTVNSLTVTGQTPLTVGQTSQYNAIANMSDGSTPNVNGQSQWSSSNPGVATVGSTGIVTAVSAGQTMITAAFQGQSGGVPLTVNAAPVQREIIGLRATLDANVLTGGGGLVNLNLSNLLSDPILDLHVYALYNDNSQEEVTSSAVIDTDNPLLRVDGPGVINLVNLLVLALTDNQHYIWVRYGGYTIQVELRINVGNIVGLELGNLLSPLQIGSKLPNVVALLQGGGRLELDANHPLVNFQIRARSYVPILGPILGPTVDAILNPLGNLVGNLLTVTGGTLTGINLGILNPVLTLLGGVLQVDVNGVLNTVPVVNSAARQGTIRF